MSSRCHRDDERVTDALDAVRKIASWRGTRDSSDDMFRSAVLRELGVVGEAVNHLSKEYTSDRPGVRWRQIAGLRNVLVHEYWDTAWPLIERLLDEHLPTLQTQLERDVRSPTEQE